MIMGAEEFNGMMRMLWKLGLDYCPSDPTEPADYIVRWGGVHSVGWNSNTNDMDEYDNPTEEEAEIMMICDGTIEDFLDKVILEDEDDNS